MQNCAFMVLIFKLMRNNAVNYTASAANASRALWVACASTIICADRATVTPGNDLE